MERPSAQTERYFSPDSKLWELNKERVVFFAGQRALLMQIAHPMIAEAVYNEGEFQKDPMARLSRTAVMGLTIIFKSKEEADAIAERIKKVHANVRGALEEPVGVHPKGAIYSARDPHQQSWVHATLVDSVIMGYEAFVRDLSDEEKESYYQDSKVIAELVGLPKDELPASWDDLQNFMEDVMENEIAVGPKARALAPLIFRPENSPRAKMAQPIVKFVTAGLLPPKIRREFGIDWKSYKDGWFYLATQGIQKTVAVLPDQIRYGKYYQEAIISATH